MRARRPLALAACGLALTAALAACGSSDHSGTSSHGASSQPSASASVSGRAADIAFAQLMIPHHEQAIEMADIALSAQAGAQACAPSPLRSSRHRARRSPR